MKYQGRFLGEALIAEGLCPPNACNVEIHIPASGALMIRYEVYVDSDDIPKIQRALETLRQLEQGQPS